MTDRPDNDEDLDLTVLGMFGDGSVSAAADLPPPQPGQPYFPRFDPKTFKLPIHAEIGDKMEIGEARRILESGILKGTTCPVCHQTCKVYYRQIYETNAKWLIEFNGLSKTRSDEWIHVSDVQGLPNGDYAKLRYWGLIEPNPKAKRGSGLFRIRPWGRLYAEGGATIPLYAVVHNNRLLGFDGPHVNIQAALETRGFSQSW
jgi:hypothetical protein